MVSQRIVCANQHPTISVKKKTYVQAILFSILGADIHNATTLHIPFVDTLISIAQNTDSSVQNTRQNASMSASQYSDSANMPKTQGTESESKHSQSKQNENLDLRLFELSGDKTLPDKEGINYAANKTKSVLWFVSNCHTKSTKFRLQYARELKKHLYIDIYGRCKLLGTKTDPCRTAERSSIEAKHGVKCDDWLMSQYKFYLSFENARCHW